MAPPGHCLLLLWLGWGMAAGEQEDPAQVVQATESETVLLPCLLGGLGPTPASQQLNLTWVGPSRRAVLTVQVSYRYPRLQEGPDMDWGQLIDNISKQENMTVVCRWEGDPGEELSVDDYSFDNEYDARPERDPNFDMNYSSSGIPPFTDFAQQGTACKKNSAAGNWTWSAVSWIPRDLAGAALSMKIWQAAPYGLRVYPDSLSLLLLSATSRDAGNYSCHWENQSHHFWLEVSAQSSRTDGFGLHFGKQHWIIWSTALGFTAICLASLFGFLRFHRAFRARRQKKKQLRSPAIKKFFHAQRSRAPTSGGTLMPLANGGGKEQADALSYENVSLGASPRSGRQSLQKGNSLPTTKTAGDDDEEYEHPDSETEQKSENEDNYENADDNYENADDNYENAEDNYENTEEEVKQEDVVLNDASAYENSKKESCGSAGSWYAHSSQKGLRSLAQDPVSEDCDNYENVEEESPLSPGATRLIAGLRLKLALDTQGDKQDGGSEASTGSQSYEEMNGTLSPTPSKSHQASLEEDADSYENMESPNSLSLQKESSLDLPGEGAAFGSVQQNLSLTFGAEL